MKKEPTILNIFLLFLYVGTILIGGGYVVLPILQKDLVKSLGWITDEELLDFYSLSQSLPGLILINVSIFIGYKLKGVPGAISAVIGSTFAAFWSIVLVSLFFFNSDIFQNLSFSFKCIEVAVILLLCLAIKEMWSKSVKDMISFIIFIFALILLIIFKLSPVQVIIISVITGTSVCIYRQSGGAKCK